MKQSFLAYCLSRPWCIQPDWLNRGLDILSREKHSIERDISIEDAKALKQERLKLVEAKLGDYTEWSNRVTVRDGIARIPVTGPICKYAGNFENISAPEMVSTERLSLEFHKALADDSISGILLDIDSPGGEAFGIAELSGMIHSAKNQKPIHAYIDGAGASAAYWIASSADKITINDTGLAGSIGTYMACYDDTKFLESKGIERIEFISSQSPNKRPKANSEEGGAQIQELVDNITTVFVSDVARNRGVDTETVLNKFGGGKVFVGKSAVEAGLVDTVGTYEKALDDIKAAVSAKSMGENNAMANGKTESRTIGQAVLAALGINPKAADQPVEDQGTTTLSTNPEVHFSTLKIEEGVKGKLDSQEAELTELKGKLAAIQSRNEALEQQVKDIQQAQQENETSAADKAAAARVDALIGKKLGPELKNDEARYTSLVAYAKMDPEGFDKNFSSMPDLSGVQTKGFAHVTNEKDAAVALTSTDEQVIAEQAEKHGRKKEDVRAEFIEAKTNRHKRMFLGN